MRITLFAVFAFFPALVDLQPKQKSNAKEESKKQNDEKAVRKLVEKANHALKTGNSKDLLALVDVPFFDDAARVIKSRKELNQRIMSIKPTDPSLKTIPFEITNVVTYEKARKSMVPKHQQLADQVLKKTDFLVGTQFRAPDGRRVGLYWMIARRNGQLKIVGLRD